MTEPFLLSTRALSLLRRGRDLVNSSMWRACSRAAILWLMNSEPLSVWNPRTLKGNARSRASRTGASRAVEARRADELELGDLVDEVEVVEALDAVEVSLVDRIDPQVAGLSEGLGPAPLADGDVHGAGRRGHRPAPALIAGRVAQVVEVSVGDGGEALEAAVAEQLQGPDAELAGGRTGEGAVEGIDFGEQPDVGLGVAAWEGVPGAAAVGDGSCGPVLVQQARDLRAREAGHLVRKRRIRPLSAFPRRE